MLITLSNPQILDRKNWEIEELKTMHRVKQKESEDNIRKMERKGERLRVVRVFRGEVYTISSLNTQK